MIAAMIEEAQHMSQIGIDLPPDAYQRLREQAEKAGKSPEVLTRERMEVSLRAREGDRVRTARQVLEAAGRVRPSSDSLCRKIVPGVTLEVVRAAMTQASGLSLSDIISNQRGLKT
jgi:hypothetical protein